MPAHFLRPLLEGHNAIWCLAMAIKPSEKRFRLFFIRRVATGDVGKTLVVLKQNAARPHTIPQAFLLDHFDIIATRFGEILRNGIKHHGPTCAPIRCQLALNRELACGTDDQAAHGGGQTFFE